MRRTLKSLIGRIIMFLYILYAYSEVNDEEINPPEVRSEKYKITSSFKAALEMIIKKVEKVCGLIWKKDRRAFL